MQTTFLFCGFYLLRPLLLSLLLPLLLSDHLLDFLSFLGISRQDGSILYVVLRETLLADIDGLFELVGTCLTDIVGPLDILLPQVTSHTANTLLTFGLIDGHVGDS